MAQLKNIAKKDTLSLDNVCYLLSQTYTQDDIGQQIATDVEKLCFCAELSITSNEFFNAGQNGIKSEVSLLVDSESYNSETSAKYNNVKYSIYRVYPRSDGMTELYLNKKVGV